MPSRRSSSAIIRRRSARRQRGAGLFSWIKNKALHWLKRNHVISSVGRVLGSAGVPYASDVSKMASAVGYGRRRRVYGGALRLAGMGLSPAGSGRRRMMLM